MRVGGLSPLKPELMLTTASGGLSNSSRHRSPGVACVLAFSEDPIGASLRPYDYSAPTIDEPNTT